MTVAKILCPGYKSEAELLKDFLEKVPSSYRCLLYICNNQIIPNLKRKYMHVQKDIDDIVLGALAEIIQKTGAYGSVKNLLWTASINRVKDWIRKLASYDERGDVSVKEVITDNWDGLENVLLKSEPVLEYDFEDQFRSFCTTLTERENEVLTLLSEGHTEEVIAVMMGIKVPTVNNLKTRVKEKYFEFFNLAKKRPDNPDQSK